MRQQAGISAQPHGAAQFIHAFQLAQLIDDAIGRGGIELGGVGVLQSAHVAREFDHHGLHAEADSEIRNFVLARITDGGDHALHSALSESAGDQDAVELLELGCAVGPAQIVRFDPVNVHLEAVRQAAVQQRFLQALVGIFVLDVLADQADVDLVFRILHAFQHAGPTAQVARPRFDLSSRKIISSTPCSANTSGTS